ncbi:MAG: hypothetical protein ACI398_01030 [Clostridium sp.]
MNINSTLQKPTAHKYQKQKNNNKNHNKNSSIYSIITIALIVISSYYITHNFYILSNSRDLYFAVEYSFTNNNDTSLLRVQNINLINSDGTNATVEVCGLAKSSPHYTVTLKGLFVKDSNGSWHLKEILDHNT